MTDTTATPGRAPAQAAAFAIILAVSFSHFINDIMQSLLSAIYPMLKENYDLDFWQIGLLTFTFQVTASLLQPVVGIDHRQAADALFAALRHDRLADRPARAGLCRDTTGCCCRRRADRHRLVDLPPGIVAHRARLPRAAGYGLAQSLFQVGGNFGQSIGPLLAAFIVVPFGQTSIAWFAIGSLIGILVLWQVGGWYSRLRVVLRQPQAGPLRLALPAPEGEVDARGPDPAGADQERLHRRHLQLLHLLRPSISSTFRCRCRQVLLFAVPRCVGARHPARRTVRRPLRTEGDDLVLDRRRAALHAGAALREP